MNKFKMWFLANIKIIMPIVLVVTVASVVGIVALTKPNVNKTNQNNTNTQLDTEVKKDDSKQDNDNNTDLYTSNNKGNTSTDNNSTNNSTNTDSNTNTGSNTNTDSNTNTGSNENNDNQTIEITLNNWNEYFEVYEWVDWNLNAFNEPTEFFGIRISFNIKNKYKNCSSSDIAMEYIINQSHNNVSYDVQKKKYEIGKALDYFDEHTSTLSGGSYESYISFSIGDMGKTTGSYEMTKYNFVRPTRIKGTLTCY